MKAKRAPAAPAKPEPPPPVWTQEQLEELRHDLERLNARLQMRDRLAAAILKARGERGRR